MRLSFQFSKKNLIWSAAYFAAALLMWVATKYPIWMLFVFVSGYALVRCTLITLNEKTRWLSWIWTAVFFLAGPVFTTYCVQHVILEDELFAKTKTKMFQLNMIAIFCIYLVFLVILAQARYAMKCAHILLLVLAFVDYFVYEFRQNEISYADLLSANTGISVLKGYRLKLHDRGAIAILATWLVFALIGKCSVKMNRIAKWIVRVAAAGILIASSMHVMKAIARTPAQTWEKKGTYKNGFVLNFFLEIQDAFVDPPENYSKDAVEQLEKVYGSSDTTTLLTGKAAPKTKDGQEIGSGEGQVKPTIIAIMDESFADFRIVGDLETNKEVMPFIDSLKENTMKGYALSSVYGAKTPNSEWEFLTGNSMAFLPDGSVVYQQYLDKTPTSIVSSLKNIGYTAIGMHPYYEAGWRRSTVYPWLGFDEALFLEQGVFDETHIMREYITDQELFDRMIERFEKKDKDEPMFFLGVTMQNHGGYKETFDNFTSDVFYTGGRVMYADANQYLSLIHQTDRAVENLISYFAQVDEPVEIVFFGDHHPSLSSGFIKSLNGKGLSGLTLSELEELFSVPYFIWTNWDNDTQNVKITSLNYLSTLTLKQANIELPPYNRFLDELMQEIPCMNAGGTNGGAFYSNAMHKFLHYDKAEGADQQLLEQYNILQYNSMFDGKNRSQIFFPYINETIHESS